MAKRNDSVKMGAERGRQGLGGRSAPLFHARHRMRFHELAEGISIITYEFVELVFVQQAQLYPIQAQLQFFVKL
jgi:hypothetical protein